MDTMTVPDMISPDLPLRAGRPDPALLAPLPATECWLDSDEAILVCRSVLDITHDVRSFHFEAADGSAFAFEPGQFVTLHLEIDGQPISRCYTISSPPTRPQRISITVKRVPGGQVSNWLHDNVVAGTRLRVNAPLGAFTLRASTARKYLFLSAGSGITPLMSMTRTLSDLASDADVLFVHSARTPADIIFRSELAAITAIHPNVRVIHVCEDDSPGDRWMGLRGRLSPAMVSAIVPDLHERLAYTCGPAAYMKSVRNILRELGFDMAGYHEESFDFALLASSLDVATIEPPALDAGRTQGRSYSVEFVRSGVTVTCPADKPLLEAAYDAGVRVPSSCTQGLCGTCKSTKLSGEVDMRHNGGIRPREVAQNKILLCCSRPVSDLRIDV